MRHNKLPYRLTTFPNGKAAQEALRGAFGAELITEPYVILLDLNMPRMNGFEFLDWLRGEQGLNRSIVFTLTTSDAAGDVTNAYSRHVAGYLIKQRLGTSYSELAGMLDAYVQANTFPPPVLEN